MASESTTTTDHDEIRQWVEDRGGVPAQVSDTGDAGNPGILRIDFPGYGADSEDPDSQLEEISWDDFFEKFEDSQLAFLYQAKKSDGEESRFCKLVSR